MLNERSLQRYHSPAHLLLTAHARPSLSTSELSTLAVASTNNVDNSFTSTRTSTAVLSTNAIMLGRFTFNVQVTSIILAYVRVPISWAHSSQGALIKVFASPGFTLAPASAILANLLVPVLAH